MGICLISGVQAQRVEMEEEKSGFVGSKVELRCRFINSSPPVKISQVTWQKLVNGSKQNVAIANPSLGVSVAPPYRDRVTFKNGAVRRRTPNLEDTTITFSSLRLSDEAAYICEYTTFPAGNRENTVNLTVLVRPTTEMSLSTPTLVAARSSKVKTPVATCVLANGKPVGTIRWESRVPGDVSTREYRNEDGTYTVQSDYILVPSRDTHRETLTCVTTYNEEVFTESVTLDIQYEPDVMVEGYDGNWYLNRENVQLNCVADANPSVSLYQWRIINASIPENVEIRDNLLIFKGPITYEIQGTYVCEATNSIGTRAASVDISVIDKPLPQIATGDVVSVIALLLAAGVLLGITITVLILKIRSRKDSSLQDSPSKKIPPSLRKRTDDIQHSGRFYEELPNTADYVSYRLACNKEDYPEPYSPPLQPPLSFLPQQPYPSARLSSGGSSCSGGTLSRNTFSPPTHTTAVFKYPSVPGVSPPPPGAAYTFPKEQYV
uniref:Ig-like domain-containing protein n=1 Tax=Knipowitschia caucasica TaxID=637954 RepID=A0AAV2J7F3_KNICA